MAHRYISLDRRAITGYIDIKTPRVVLIDILDSHGFNYSEDRLDDEKYREKLLSKLSFEVVPSFLFEGEFKAEFNRDYQRVATFVNKHYSWPYSKLGAAYKWLLLFYRDEGGSGGGSQPTPLSPLTIPFQYGAQTPEQPYRINASVLYAYCRQYCISLDYNSSMEEMATAITLFQGGRKSLLDNLHNNLDKLSLSALVNVMLHLNRHPDNDNNKVIIRERVRREAREYRALKINRLDDRTICEIRLRANVYNKAINRAQIQATDDIDAIVMAAINYCLDLSDAINPLEEYGLIRTNDYEPKDIGLRKRLESKFKELDSPYLNQCFNPRLPPELYKMTTLERLAKNTGYTYEQIQHRDLYELLLEASILNNFYHGKHTSAKNSNTLIDDISLNECSFHSCVSYGLKDNFYVYTYEELERCFSTNNNFQDPSATLGVQFSDLAINKLSLLTARSKYSDESAQDYSNRQALHRCILQVRKYLENKFTEYNAFIHQYQKESESTKCEIREIVEALHNLAMYMRGWNGQSALPIRRAPVDDQLQVYIRVSKQFSLFEEAALKYPAVLELPLLKYEAGKFVTATDKEYGLKIGERLSIIKNDNDNTNSCIRLSSKWLAGTSYYLMGLLGLTPPYKIEQLMDIS